MLCGVVGKLSKFITPKKHWLYCCDRCLATPSSSIAETCNQCQKECRYFRAFRCQGFICLLCDLKRHIAKESAAQLRFRDG